MRIKRVVVGIVLCIALSGQAHAASSILVLGDGEPAKATPSIAAARAAAQPVTQSIVALGKTASPVSGGQVAAISASKSKQGPTVIRGGIFGDSAPEPVAVAEPESTEKLSRPAQRKLERDKRRAIRESRASPEAPDRPSSVAPADGGQLPPDGNAQPTR